MADVTVVCLAGGTGGAKLARGLLDVLDDPAELAVVVNTGDDVESYGAYVSPDPDLVTFWLADRIDARGWGLEGDTFVVMDALRDLGEDVWFNLGDNDLAVCLQRAQRLREGWRLTDCARALAESLDVRARVLPMCDEPVRTAVQARDAWHEFQAFMIRERGEGPVQDVSYDGAGDATLPGEVREAIAGARAILVGPSNPVISIGPILAVPGMREALAASPAPVVAVSPLVGGHVVKGPTEPFMDWMRLPLTSDGIAAVYEDVADGLLADAPASTLPTQVTDVLMADAEGRARVAREALAFAGALASSS